MKRLIVCFALTLLVAGCDNKPVTNSPNSGPNSNNSTNTTSNSSPDKDNTAVNARDKNSDEKTPIDQNENKADIDLTAKIRKEVVATKMSVNAQNVKIITQNGEVTLRGPVASAEEKQKIEDIARSVAGNDKVVSKLEIEANP